MLTCRALFRCTHARNQMFAVTVDGKGDPACECVQDDRHPLHAAWNTLFRDPRL